MTYHTYLELPAPYAAVAALLEEALPSGRLPFGAERIGTLWRHGEELYQVERVPNSLAEPATFRLHWLATPAAGRGPHLDICLTLHDAIISTHIQVEIGVTGQEMRWPWRRFQLRNALAAATHACHASLAAELIATAKPARMPALALADIAVIHAGVATSQDRQPELPGLIGATTAQLDLVEELQARYPQTVEHFAAIDALDHLERVVRLEHGWKRLMQGKYEPGVHEIVASLGDKNTDQTRQAVATTDFDLIYAGGGLGLLHATVMAVRYGWRVMVFDRGEVGCAHREWNISRVELQALVDNGVASWAELGDVVMREYRDGLVRFHRAQPDAVGTELWLPTVLNVALDAGALLRLMRRRLEAAGGTVLSGRAFRTVRVGASGPMEVEVELEPLDRDGTVERYRARLLLDGMGSTSPLAMLRHAGQPFAGVCPTVGTVAAGFAQGDSPQEYDPSRGDILVSIADAQGGEQLMWEGFPGRNDELTVYLFYYSTIQSAGRAVHGAGVPRGYSLLDLFEQYFTLLPSYKRPGPGFHHIKPVYGYIPARHSLRSQEAPLLRGVVPVGDSAAQQSPLTFCGFGSHVRNLDRITGLLDHALRHDLLAPEELANVNAFQTNVSLNWVFSRFMHPWGKADDVNQLQNLFLDVLHELGVDTATRFFQDRMRWGDYHPMILGVLRRYPAILLVSLKVLGLGGMMQWAGDYLRFSGVAAVAALARTAGPQAEVVLVQLADMAAPAIGLRLRARFAEWRSMGWV